MGYPARALAVRFAEKHSAAPSSECWLWTDRLDEDGYGHIQVPGNTAKRAHRVAYELHVGPIPRGLMVCHHCDVRHCVNPAHLFLGTAADNNADMMAKGRFIPGGKPHPGAANGRALLTEAEAVEILLRRARGQPVSPLREARARGMNRSSIDRLVNGHAWKHLPRSEAALAALLAPAPELETA